MLITPSSQDGSSAVKERSWKNTFFWIFAGLFFFGGGVFRFAQSAWSTYQANRELDQYKPAIADCVERKQAEANGQQIIGLEYECAIDIASTFYATDSEKALRLCMKYNPLFTTDIHSKDPIDRQNVMIARSACELGIQRRVRPTPTP